MAKQKNLVVFYTDQQRVDTLGCYGSPVAQTPRLDVLAAGGARFDNHYVVNPVCMPSRAAFITGRYPQANRVIDNGIPLPEDEFTMAHALQEAGYRTCSVGKLHFTPYGADAAYGYPESWQSWKTGQFDDWHGPYYGFDEVHLTLGHGEGCYGAGGHYTDWVLREFGEIPGLGFDAAPDPKEPAVDCWPSRLPVAAHHSTWVAKQACACLDRLAKEERPFFLYVSFPDPHHPFAAPLDYLRRFEGVDMPAPHRVKGENDTKPAHYRRAMHEAQHPRDGGARRIPELTDDVLAMVMRHYHASVALIDESIGRVLDALRALGLDGDTTTAFTADHGELLGDHWMLFKGPYPCRSLLQVPFLIADPDVPAQVVAPPMSNIDAAPTLLDLVGVTPPPSMQGVSFRPLLAGETSTPPRDAALTSGWSKDGPAYYHHSIYTATHRLSLFPNQGDGELYDLEADPHEFRNVYHDPAYRAIRTQLTEGLLLELGRAEAPNSPAICSW